MNIFSAPWRKLSAAALTYGNRLIAALTDIRSRELNARWLLLAYLAVWTLYAIIEKSSQDINFDMAEVVAWSRELALGSPKHPQLSAWIAALWFAIFPYEDWAYYLLAIASATSALWIAWSFSKRWLDPDNRVAGLAMLMLVPFFNFLAIKYNANSVLVPFWALTSYCFLLSYSTRSPLFAALTGAGAGACMLGKYWSIFLIAGLGIAAIVDARRSAYFRSWAPWITIAAGSLVLSPHVVWLFSNNFSTFDYPIGHHGGHTLWFSATKVFFYIENFAAYIVVPILFVLLAARPTASTVKEFFWPKGDDARLASLAFWLPLALPIPVVLFLHADITAIWAIPAVSLLPVVLLSSKTIILARNAVAAIVLLAAILPLIALILSPGIAIANHLRGTGYHGNAGQQRLLAKEIEKNWRNMTDQPLRLVGGNPIPAFYIDRSSSVDILKPERTPWADEARIKRDGIAIICGDQACIDTATAYARVAPESRRIEVTVARRYLGLGDVPTDYTLILIAPESHHPH